MKNWASALFPLSILLALTGLTFWLRYATELPELRRDGKHRHDPDYIVTEATIRKLDKGGQLNYTLQASEIRHYPDDDTTEISRPNLVYLKARKPTVTMTADNAHLSKDSEQVDLYGNVRIIRAPSAKEEALTATTSQLTVLPNEEKAFTKSPVLITQGQSWARGVGFRMDSRAQTYVLESQARASMESKHSRKQKP